MHAKMEATKNVFCNLSKGLTHNIVSASLPTTNSIKPPLVDLGFLLFHAWHICVYIQLSSFLF